MNMISFNCGLHFCPHCTGSPWIWWCSWWQRISCKYLSHTNLSLSFIYAVALCMAIWAIFNYWFAMMFCRVLLVLLALLVSQVPVDQLDPLALLVLLAPRETMYVYCILLCMQEKIAFRMSFLQTLVLKLRLQEVWRKAGHTTWLLHRFAVWSIDAIFWNSLCIMGTGWFFCSFRLWCHPVRTDQTYLMFLGRL